MQRLRSPGMMRPTGPARKAITASSPGPSVVPDGKRGARCARRASVEPRLASRDIVGAVYCVGLAQVAGTVEQEAAQIAVVLGNSAYDVRLWMNGVLPRVVYRSESRDAALSVHQALAARGHGAVLCSLEEVTPSASMVHMRRFIIDDLGLAAHEDGRDSLAWDDLEALVHVVSRTNVERTTREKEIVYNVRGARTEVERDWTTHEYVSQQALYLFPRNGARPWLLLEREAHYLGLGEHMGPTRRENFDRAMALIRARASRAVFDDRFAKTEMSTRRDVSVRGNDQPELGREQSRATDLVIHMLKLWLCRDRSTPYR